MANPVRRLALDIGPLVWAYIVFQFCVGALLDFAWLLHSGAVAQPLLPGVLLIVGSMYSAQKVPFWRTLPVSRAEIDRARWWQGIAAPPLLLCLTGVGTALVMGEFGLRSAPWPDIATLVLGQSAVSILVGGTMFVAFPFAALRFGRWGALLLVPYMLGMFRLILPLGKTSAELHIFLWALDAVGLVVAVALYALAGRWPSPLTVPLWSLPPRVPAGPEPASAKTSGRRGWPSLIWANALTLVIMWAVTAAVLLVMKWYTPRMDLTVLYWFTCLATLQFCVTFIATGMRNLRALPLSGRQLTFRLVLLVLSVQAISLLVLKLVMLLVGARQFMPAVFLLPLAYSLVYLPVALRLGLRIIRFGFAFSFIFIIPLQLITLRSDIALWIVVGSFIAMVAGSAWTYWEIARGHSAYRHQPLVPARWRGF